MSTSAEHNEHCQHNTNFLASFLLIHSNDWAITVMFYIAVHAMESLLGGRDIHCQNHQSRKSELAKLDIDGLKDALRLYKLLERKAHDSRYTNYKVYDWEAHRAYKDTLRKIIIWFNDGNFGNIQIDVCDKRDEAWYSRYTARDPECNKCH
ncbi:MAG: hypothetical protein IJ734_00600 [Fibrobacter sp.]|nr:hypothetical protein [Fibrobacter sp.]